MSMRGLWRRWWGQPTSGAVPPSHPPEHAAAWGHVTVYFVHTVSTRRPIRLGKAVRSLLKSELASAAAWPSEDVVRLSPTWAGIDRAADDLRRVQGAIEAEGESSAFRFWLRHPVTMFRLFRYTRQEPTTDIPGDDPATSEQSPNTVQEIDKVLLDRQKLLIMERTHERELFADEPEDSFVRLDLRGSYHTVTVGDAHRRVVLEPRLLLHRDGALQLTVGVALPEAVSTAHVVEASRPDAAVFTTSEIPETYAASDEDWTGGKWADGLDGGQRMRVFAHDEAASVHEWMEIVASRVLGLIEARQNGSFLTYPVTIAEAGNCCDNWPEAHEHDITQAVLRTVPPAGERLHPGGNPDFGIGSGARVYATLASAFVLELRRWRPGISDLNYTLLFERTVLLYTRLRSLERSLLTFTVPSRRVSGVYRSALELERESRGGHILAGTARDIATHVLQEMGVPAMLDVISRGTSMLGERMSTRASERAARTSNRYAAVGLFVAAVAAVPAVPSILEFIADQRAANPDVTAWVLAQELLTSPLQLSAVLLAVLAGIALTAAVTVVARVTRTLLSWRKSGWASRVSGYRIVPSRTEGE